MQKCTMTEYAESTVKPSLEGEKIGFIGSSFYDMLSSQILIFCNMFWKEKWIDSGFLYLKHVGASQPTWIVP